MKFSIIVPVYNVEKYIIKCLESISEQTHTNYEVIIVNDGSVDNSEILIKNYIKNKSNFKYYKKENGGLSDARNYGVKKATGDYILFIDSDDYINNELLFKLDLETQRSNDDIVKFNLEVVDVNNNRISKKTSFTSTNADIAIKQILKDEYVEPAVLYCYKRSFWMKNEYEYAKGRYHEDFGLTPLILMDAKKISSIDYIGYNYVMRENSITTDRDIQKNLKKFYDCLYFFDTNIKIIEKNKNINKETKDLLYSYYANGIINKSKTLEKTEFNKVLKELKTRKLYRYLLDNTLKRKIKKILYRIMPKIYIKGLMR